LGKKCYLDVLDTGKLHIRMKGISESAIRAYGNVEDVYNRLYNGESLEFDLCAGNKPIFKQNTNFTIKTLKQFKRVIKF
jgi:hypothetical protein